MRGIQGTKLEIESVLRETCERVLGDPTITREKALLRAMALQILGEAFMSVRKEDRSEESEYVRVETRNSREREAQSRKGQS
jgi:hypothetical protein